jgi:general secretion pathway protein F
MPSWRWRAVKGGAVIAGVTQGADRAAVVAQLRAEGKMLLEIAPARSGALWALLNTEITPRGAISTADRVAFTRSLATLVEAGLTLDRALAVTRDLGDRRAARALAARLRDAVAGGASLADAMGREAAALPPAYRSMVRAAEASATLAPTLARLADAEEAAARRASALRGALIYPAFLVAAAIGSIAVLLTLVVPTFAPMLRDAAVEPPLATRVVIGAAEGAMRWGPLIGLPLAAGVLALLVASLRPGPRRALHAAALRAPLIGPLRRKLASARMARLLGETLAGGVPLTAALRLTRDALSDAAFVAALDAAIPQVEAGRGLAAPLAATGAPSPLALQLIGVGEESGRLAPMLLKCADILDEQARGAVDRLLAILTPAITLVMGGVVALIVSSILFALFSINELAVARP